jgi:hypothetical protein
MAPPGPPPCLDISGCSPGAFDQPCCQPECAAFFHIGTQAYERQKLGKGVVAFSDPRSNGRDTGQAPLPTDPAAERYGDLTPNMAFGVRGAVGYLYGENAVELTGFFIPENTSSVTAASPGRLNAVFTNPPAGFGGVNGLFRQADVVSTSLTSTLGDAELNFRTSSAALNEVDLILGVRYFDQKERLSTFVDDQALTTGPNPLFQADYSVQAHNRLVAPQLGFEWQHPCLCWLSVAAVAKGAWGVNFVDFDYRLVRGDGRVGFDQHRSTEIFSHLYEVGFFFDFHLLEKARIRAGYDMFWFLQEAAVIDQVSFDLSDPAGRRNTNGSVFYHGPTIELQLLF